MCSHLRGAVKCSLERLRGTSWGSWFDRYGRWRRVCGVSTARVARTPETVKAKRGCDDHYFTVVSPTMMYYRCVVLNRKMKNGMNSRSVYVANSYKL